MDAVRQRAVWGLGLAQCVYWGLFYYGFSALLLPMQRDLGLDRITLAGAFSLGLLLTALLAPAVGRQFDRGTGARVLRLGALLGAAGLVLLASSRGALSTGLAWLVMGIAMAGALYEPAFGLVIRRFEDHLERMRALSAVTVIGGLASTIWLPLFALAIEAFSWRGASLLAALVVLVTAVAVERFVLPPLHTPVIAVPKDADRTAVPHSHPSGTFAILQAIAVAGTLASVALSILLIPLLIERGVTPVLAAAALGMFGLAQLPGRLWLLRARQVPSPAVLAGLPMLLQAAGLLLIVATGTLAAAALGVALFGLGAGTQALARPWLVQHFHGTRSSGVLNGRIARSQGFARALAPVSAAALSQTLSIPMTLAALALMLLLLLPLAIGLSRHPACDDPSAAIPAD
jgi:MFS family permease